MHSETNLHPCGCTAEAKRLQSLPFSSNVSFQFISPSHAIPSGPPASLPTPSHPSSRQARRRSSSRPAFGWPRKKSDRDYSESSPLFCSVHTSERTKIPSSPFVLRLSAACICSHPFRSSSLSRNPHTLISHSKLPTTSGPGETAKSRVEER